MALEFSNTSELVKLARKSGRLLSENFLFPYHSQSNWLRKHLDGRLTGSVYNISSRFFIPSRLDSDIRYKKNLGGGAFNDLGCYMVRAMTYFFGESYSPISSNIYMSRQYNVDVMGDASFLVDNSLKVDFAWGFDSAYECSLTIHGSKGRLKTDRFFTMPPNEKPMISFNGNDFCSLNCDNQYLNKWNSLHMMLNSKSLVDSHLSSLLFQAKSLDNMRINASYCYI